MRGARTKTVMVAHLTRRTRAPIPSLARGSRSYRASTAVWARNYSSPSGSWRYKEETGVASVNSDFWELTAAAEALCRPELCQAPSARGAWRTRSGPCRLAAPLPARRPAPAASAAGVVSWFGPRAARRLAPPDKAKPACHTGFSRLSKGGTA